MIKFKSVKEKVNPLFNRREIEAVVESKITPSYKDIRKVFSEKYSVPVENLKINLIKGKFGFQEFIVKINIYKNKEEKEIIEKKSKKEIEAEKLEEQEKKAESETTKNKEESGELKEKKENQEKNESEKTLGENKDKKEEANEKEIKNNKEENNSEKSE